MGGGPATEVMAHKTKRCHRSDEYFYQGPRPSLTTLRETLWRLLVSLLNRLYNEMVLDLVQSDWV